MKQKWKQFLLFLAIPTVLGFLIGLLTSAGSVYQTLDKPPLSPPGIVFPIVWTILYILMGISSYLIFNTCHKERKKALIVYFFQLFLNLLWPILFFTCQNYFLSLLELLFLIYVVIKMIILFFTINKTAGYLQIPYLLWLLFASYLNMGIVFLN